MGAGFTGRLRPERVFDMQVERETGQMDLRLRKVILRSCLMARWSEMERSGLETLWMWRPVKQTWSRMCPRLWVGRLMFWVKLKRLWRSRKSIAFLHSGESMWSLKSQRSKTDGEI